MRILIAVHHFPPTYTAGAEWQAFRTAKGLQARGHTVNVVAVDRVDCGPDGGVTWSDDVYDGVPVRRLCFDRSKLADESEAEYRNEWIASHLKNWWIDLKPDLMHVVSGYLLSGSVFEAAESASLPTVLTLTDFWWLCRRITMLRSNGAISDLPIEPWRCAQCLAEEGRMFRTLGRVAPRMMETYWKSRAREAEKIQTRQTYLRERFDRIQQVISPSQFLCDLHTRAGVAPDRIVVSRQGIELVDLGMPQRFPKQPSDRLRVTYLGQIAELKGVHLLVDAARQIDDPRLQVRIFGDLSRFPDYVAQLRTRIGSDSRIVLSGAFRGGERLAAVLADTDILVVPSLWYENSPNVLLEAFAMGTPALVSDFGGMAELVKPEVNGLRFRLGDAADLAKQLRRVLDEPDLLEKLKTGIPTVRSIREEMDALEGLYASVLEAC